MVGIVVSGHGNFGSGLTSSLNLIAGNPAEYEYVDFIESYSVEDLDRELRSAFDKLSACDGIIVLTDLAGGSPFKTAVVVAQDYKNVHVIGGTNLPMLIELSMARTMMEDVDALVDMSISTGKAQVVKFEMKERVEPVNTGDGI